MNRKNITKATATAAVGLIAAAGTFAFTSVDGQPSAHDSLRNASQVTVSDHDSFGNLGASASAGTVSAQASASSSDSASYAGGRQGQLVTGAASSASQAAASQAAGSQGSQARELDLDIDLGTHDTNCTRVAVMELTARAALDCGLDAADWALVTVSTTYRQALNNVQVVTDTATEVVEHTTNQVDQTVDRAIEAVDRTVDRTVETVKGQVNGTVSTVKDIASEVVSDTFETTGCVLAATGQVLDTSARDLVACA